MKKLLFLLLIAPVLGFGQDYMDEIALDTCLCIEEDIIKRKKPVKENKIPYEFALCVIQSAEPYVDDINKDFNLDIDSEKGAQQLIGMLIIKLGLKCPDNFKELSENLQ
jgi:hypothetical protein